MRCSACQKVFRSLSFSICFDLAMSFRLNFFPFDPVSSPSSKYVYFEKVNLSCFCEFRVIVYLSIIVVFFTLAGFLKVLLIEEKKRSVFALENVINLLGLTSIRNTLPNPDVFVFVPVSIILREISVSHKTLKIVCFKSVFQ